MIRQIVRTGTILAFFLMVSWSYPAHSQHDKNLIRIKGSDTLAKVTSEWGAVFSENDREVTIEVSGGGSGNGIAALINGHVEVANTSRKLRKREKRLISKKTNKKPYIITVGLDAVSILVHNDNPMNAVSLAQLAGIYGSAELYSKWSDLGITIPSCKSGEIVRVSRKNNSGTYAFFRQAIFGKRSHLYRGLVTYSGSQDVVGHVSKDPCSIGYSAMAFLDSSVKTLCITQPNPNKGCVPPTAAYTLNNKYPLSRPLFMYTMGEPEGKTRAFLSWVKSSEGQHILRKAGFVSAPTEK
jgi:phosphate transport system substrate-binding protein